MSGMGWVWIAASSLTSMLFAGCAGPPGTISPQPEAPSDGYWTIASTIRWETNESFPRLSLDFHMSPMPGEPVPDCSIAMGLTTSKPTPGIQSAHFMWAGEAPLGSGAGGYDHVDVEAAGFDSWDYYREWVGPVQDTVTGYDEANVGGRWLDLSPERVRQFMDYGAPLRLLLVGNGIRTGEASPMYEELLGDASAGLRLDCSAPVRVHFEHSASAVLAGQSDFENSTRVQVLIGASAVRGSLSQVFPGEHVDIYVWSAPGEGIVPTEAGTLRIEYPDRTETHSLPLDYEPPQEWYYSAHGPPGEYHVQLDRVAATSVGPCAPACLDQFVLVMVPQLELAPDE